MKLVPAVLAIAITSALTGCGGSSSSNSAPVFGQTSYQVQASEDQSISFQVSARDSDGNDTVTYSLANASSNASVDINAATGEITYLANANFNGEDSFEVRATDGKEPATVVINVTVAAVNDIPVFDASEVIVSGGEVKKGTIQASDVDEDTLSYQIVQTTQNGDLSIEQATGEITYTPTELIDVNDSFTLLISDGNGGELTKELTIKANLASNTDRAYYYYASEQSHLKQAETQITSLNNDLNQGLVFNSLAVGYAEAGLTNQVERLITPEQIVRDEMRARTILDVSFVYNALNLTDKADTYRLEANALYTAYVAAKGVRAFDNNDAEFFTDLAASYNAADNTEKANEVLGILDTLFAAAIDGDSTTAALRTFFGYRNLVDSAVEDWQQSRSQEDYDLAHSMAVRLYDYANLISHRFVSNDRNGNEGKPYHSVRQVALGDVVKSFLALNDTDSAKEALHDIFALHGVVGIDENYPRTANEYYEVTRVEYEYGLYGVIEEFVVLYPETTLEQYLTGFPEGSFWAGFAEEDAADARLMAQVRSMEDKDAALALVIAEKDPEKLRNHFTNLVAFNSSNPGGAIYLKNQGDYAAAAKFLQEAIDVLKTDDYISQNLDSEAFVTGQTGCEMVLDELSDLYRITSEETYKTQAQSTIEACIAIAQQHYANGDDGTDVQIDDAVKAQSRFLKFANSLDITEQRATLLDTIETNIKKINTEDHEELISRLQGVGYSLAVGAQYQEAQDYYDRGIEQLNLLEKAVPVEEIGNETGFFFDSSSSADYQNFLAVIEQRAGTFENYAQVKEAAYSAWNDVIDTRLTELASRADQQKVTFIPGYANQLVRLSMFEKALTLSNDEALGVVEKESIITQVASGQSVADDFKQTLVATVDTDGDGKANFYLESATEQAIANSGIELDEDSDNDGVNDDQDSYPLDASKQ